jgi:hypothetical protein
MTVASLPYCLRGYRDEPIISRAGLTPAGILRLRGAPIYYGLCGWFETWTFSNKLVTSLDCMLLQFIAGFSKLHNFEIPPTYREEALLPIATKNKSIYDQN